jgi:hypothetical protein
MTRTRRSRLAFLAAAFFATSVMVLFVLSATRLSGDTVGMWLSIAAAVASAFAAFGFFLQWSKSRHKEGTTTSSK